VISQLEKGEPKSSRHSSALRIGVDTLPPLPRDATDRNRTSPFAFTGNKFEFRAPGSSQSCSGANVVLNTIVADAFDRISDAMDKFGKKDFHDSLQSLLQKIVKEHKRIIFNGDGYAGDWLAEAAKRGLPNSKTTMDALKALTISDNVALFEKYGVFKERELESRYEVFMEDYHRKVKIEGSVALDIAESMVYPALAAEFGKHVKILSEAKDAASLAGVKSVKERAKLLGGLLDTLTADTQKLRTALSGKHEGILAAMAAIRKTVDEIEKYVPDSCWPLPKYSEMLFIY
ncbi:MAG: hypothetical protein J5833_00905, partial [Victivallales bacterium]|nr:hypothetical protein [Victivallales bacterium]